MPCKAPGSPPRASKTCSETFSKRPKTGNAQKGPQTASERDLKFMRFIHHRIKRHLDRKHGPFLGKLRILPGIRSSNNPVKPPESPVTAPRASRRPRKQPIRAAEKILENLKPRKTACKRLLRGGSKFRISIQPENFRPAENLHGAFFGVSEFVDGLRLGIELNFVFKKPLWVF